MSQKRVFRVVSKINDGPEFLNAPCLASKNTIKKLSGGAINAVSQDKERFPVDRRRRTRQFPKNPMAFIPGLVMGLAVVAPEQRLVGHIFEAATGSLKCSTGARVGVA